MMGDRAGFDCIKSECVAVWIEVGGIDSLSSMMLFLQRKSLAWPDP